jgi:hypothetical protein
VHAVHYLADPQTFCGLRLPGTLAAATKSLALTTCINCLRKARREAQGTLDLLDSLDRERELHRFMSEVVQ